MCLPSFPALSWDATSHFPIDALRAAAELGFGGIYVRDDVGGCGMGRLDAAVVFEALAYGDVSVTAYLTIHNMVCYMIDTFGSDEQRARLLPGLVRMDSLASYCLTEPGDARRSPYRGHVARPDLQPAVWGTCCTRPGQPAS